MTKVTLRSEIYEILLGLIDEYHIPEGTSTEEAADHILSLIRKELIKEIDIIPNKDNLKDIYVVTSIDNVKQIINEKLK